MGREKDILEILIMKSLTGKNKKRPAELVLKLLIFT
jgi:hypothetical protein